MERRACGISHFAAFLDEADMDGIPNNDILCKVSAIVAQIAGQNNLIQTITPTDHLVDRGMTSMAMVDLMLAVEAEFDVTIPQREMTPSNFQSIASLAQMLGRI